MLKRTRTSEKTERRAAPSKIVRRTRVPRLIKPALYKFRRTLQQGININLSTGFAAGGYALLISPALSSCSFFINATLAFQPVMPGLTEFTGLFDSYKISRVNLEIFFSNNDSVVTSPATVLPLVHIVNDYNDTNNFSLTDIQQYPNMQTFQMGKEKPIRWSLKPRMRLDALTDSGVLSSSAFNTTGWLDTSSANIQHLGTKIFLNTLGRNGNTDVGSIVVIVTYDLEFRNVR